jgi:hypothetical protein
MGKKCQVCYHAGIILLQEYHQYLFNHSLKQVSQASIKTLMGHVLHCHEFFAKLRVYPVIYYCLILNCRLAMTVTPNLC